MQIEFSESMQKEIKQAFNLLCVDGSETINAEGLKVAMKAIGLDESQL